MLSLLACGGTSPQSPGTATAGRPTMASANRTAVAASVTPVPSLPTSGPLVSPTPIAVPTGSPTPMVTPTIPPTAIPALMVVATTPGRAANIIVEQPAPGAMVHGVVHVRGQARVFEAVVSVRLSVNKATVEEVSTMATAGAPVWGAYSVDLPLPSSIAGGEAVVGVFSRSARDGSIQDLVEVPIRVGRGVASPTASPVSQTVLAY